MSFVLGISAHYHDSSVSLVRDGEVVFAAGEERFSRIKNDQRIPVHAFRHALEFANLGPQDLAAVGYYENPLVKAERQIASAWLKEDPTSDFALIDPARVERDIREALGFDGEFLTFAHHQSHAASAAYCSGFEQSAVLVADAVGEWATTSQWFAQPHEMSLLFQQEYPNSIGMLYSAITAFLGFEVNEGEYKVMGLAPYGQPIFEDKLGTLISLKGDGSFLLDFAYFSFDRTDGMFSQSLAELLGVPARVTGAEITQIHCDIAASLQRVLERVMVDQCRSLKQRTGSDKLSMAGGVALNCVANAVIRATGIFEDLFVQPAAGDAGGAIGAALLADQQLNGTPQNKPRIQSMYLGTSPTVDRLAYQLTRSNIHFKRLDDTGLAHYVASRLDAGAVVGWCQGRMEFGPRALGARSILADPRSPDMRDRINAKVKLREGFRPFAPIALESDAEQYFVTHGRPLPYMLETVAVSPESSLPAVTHIDGSARLQTVPSNSQIPRLVALLEAFRELTGCGVLLNTSFNQKGEPIVADEGDALECFIRSQLDVLVVDDLVLEYADLPQSWISFFATNTFASRSGIPTHTYTLL